MKKILALCLVMIFIFIGCSSDKLPNKEPDVVGLIYKIENESQRILVVKDIESVNIPYDEWFEAGNYAAFFKVDKDTTIIKDENTLDFSALEIGQKVELWHTGILAESYPMQGQAVYINIID